MKLNDKHNILEEINDTEKLLAVLSYIPFLCFIPLFKNNIGKFARKHLKQGLILLILEIIALFFLVDIFSKIFWSIVLIICFAIACIGMLTAFSGNDFKVPAIGNFFEKYEI